LDLRALVAKTRDAGMLRLERRQLRQAIHHTAADVDYPKLVDGNRRRIKDAPPLIFHPDGFGHAGFRKTMIDALERYRESMPEERRVLLDRYRFVDAAVKVVGIGSVGTACGVILLLADGEDPLFLQIKQARPSVLERWAGASRHANPGQRVVVGQRIMQA